MFTPRAAFCVVGSPLFAAVAFGCGAKPARHDSAASVDGGGQADGGADGAADGEDDSGGVDASAPVEALVVGAVQPCAAPLSAVSYVEHGAELGFLDRGADLDRHIAGSSLIVDDFDSDGDLDIVQGMDGAPLRVYWADGEAFRAEDLTPGPESGRARPFDGDRDGLSDVVMINPPFIWPRAEAGLEPSTGYLGFGPDPVLLDAQPMHIDDDGLLDFFVPGNAPVDDPERRRDRLLFGAADGSPRVEPLPGVEATGNAAQASAIDWDGDGDLDVMVTNDMGFYFGGNQLWLNDAGALRPGAAAGCLPTISGMAHAFGDYDGDGREDVFVGGTLEGRLLRRLPDGTCIDYARSLGADPLISRPISLNPMIWATAFLDFDNDGLLDILHSEGDLYNGDDGFPRYEAPIDLMQQQARGTFVDVGPALGLARAGSHRAIVPEDLNGDGVLDLIVADVEAPLRLYLSTGCTAAAWLRVEAPEHTTVEVLAGGERWMAVARQEVSVGGFRRSLVHIGLGNVDQIDRLTLRPLQGEAVVIEGPIDPRRTVRWTP